MKNDAVRLVSVRAKGQEERAIEIADGKGLVVRVPVGADPSYVRVLLTQLQLC